MSDDVKPPIARRSRLVLLRAFGPVALAGGGLAAAFGAASCCAIPMLLGGIGLGGLGSAIFVPVLGPYQHVMLGAAAVCLLAGGGFLWRRGSCACRGARAATTATLIGLALGTVLLALGLAYG
jgi:mercuric ion transport protein